MAVGIASVQEFREIIRSSSPVIVFFHLSWSGPCKSIAPDFEKFSRLPELRGLRFYQVDCDTSPDISEFCGISNTPVFIVYQSNSRVYEVVGSDKPRLQSLLKKYII